MRDSSSLVMHRARVRRDSVVGLIRREGSFQPASVSREQVGSIQLREFSAVRTLLLVGAILGAVFWTIERGLREGYTT